MGAQTDNCPPWAESLIKRIKSLEIQSGNLLPDDDYTSLDVTNEDLTGNRDKHSESADALFNELARKACGEGFSPENVAVWVNSRLTTGHKLSYCSADDVADELA